MLERTKNPGYPQQPVLPLEPAVIKSKKTSDTEKSSWTTSRMMMVGIAALIGGAGLIYLGFNRTFQRTPLPYKSCEAVSLSKEEFGQGIGNTVKSLYNKVCMRKGATANKMVAKVDDYLKEGVQGYAKIRDELILGRVGLPDGAGPELTLFATPACLTEERFLKKETVFEMTTPCKRMFTGTLPEDWRIRCENDYQDYIDKVIKRLQKDCD